MTTALIRARGLTKRFGSFTAVDGVDFELHRGEAFGFLGPNGAGKSSTMRMIGCVSPPTEGELSIFGLDPVTDGPAIRARLGVVPQEGLADVIEGMVRFDEAVHRGPDRAAVSVASRIPAALHRRLRRDGQGRLRAPRRPARAAGFRRTDPRRGLRRATRSRRAGAR